MSIQKVKKAIIPAAGLGSRMYPFAKVETKLMIPILNKPIIAYLLEELTASGIEEVIIVSNYTSRLKKLFEEDEQLNEILRKMKKSKVLKNLHHLEHMSKLDFIRQDKPMGWLHEVVHAKEHLEGETFIVCFSDVIYDAEVPPAKQLIDLYNKTGKNIKSRARFLLKPNAMEIAKKESFELGKDEADVDMFDKLEEKGDLLLYTIKGKFYNVGDPLSYLKTQTIFGIKNKAFGKEYLQWLDEEIV